MHLVEITILSLYHVIVKPKKYQQSQQKLDTFLEDKVFHKSKISKKFINKSWSPSLIFFKKNQKELTI